MKDFSKFQQSKEWDGTGKHPVLGKTKEEIVALNEGVTDRHAENHADTDEKKAQPNFEEQVGIQTEHSQFKQEHFINRIVGDE